MLEEDFDRDGGSMVCLGGWIDHLTGPLKLLFDRCVPCIVCQECWFEELTGMLGFVFDRGDGLRV